MRRPTRVRLVNPVAIATLLVSLAVAPATVAPPIVAAGTAAPGLEVSSAVRHDVSPPLRNLRPTSPSAANLRERPLLRTGGPGANGPDGALQTTTTGSIATATTAGLGFAGVGQGDYGFTDRYAPPDTNGAVGATQYVQWVNVSFAIFSKSTGALVYGPVPGNTLWSGFGGGCEANNNGDPIVRYDAIAGRWIFTQFSVSTTPYLQCVAVSTTSDATGTYNRYAFSFGTTQFPDYPKLGVWRDAYYMSFNIFNNGSTWAGAKACALDSSAMLAGTAATMQCFQLSTSYGSLLPSDLDGTAPPPAGSPDFFMDYGANVLNLWKFHVDFGNSANTTFTGPTSIPVASFSAACNGGGTCIPQPSTNQRLDSLADRLMYRLAYRHFADGHEAMVVNQSVTAGTSTGIRWYELRNATGSSMAAGTPVVYQQGTYAPDSNYRWMGSIAMDASGDIAVGYSVSSGSLYPSIRYTGRVPGDPLNTLEAETSIKAGSGSQLQNLSRWGDYSAMSVDPVDGCTFWYTNEYLKSSGTFNWSTWITSFRFPGCGVTQTLTSITVRPATASVATGSTQQFTATAYDQTGQPMSTPPTFTWSVSGGGTIDSTGLFTATTASSNPYTVTASAQGTSGTVSGTASVTVTAQSGDFSLSASPSSVSVKHGGTASYTVTITPSGGFSGSVTLSLGGQPSGSVVTFTPNPATSSATLTVKTAGYARGTYPLTITGTSGSLVHTASATLVVK